MQRFWSKIEKTDTCWVWKAGVRSKKTGYGAIKYQGKVYNTHRFSWFLHYGKMPEKLICHTCDNRLCVRPEHLFEGTASDNAQDAVAKNRQYMDGLREQSLKLKTKTKCKRGHIFTKQNTGIRKQDDYDLRYCKTCNREKTRKWRIRLSERIADSQSAGQGSTP